MEKLKGDQKAKVQQVTSMTGCGVATAIFCLTKHNFDVNTAINRFMDNPGAYTQKEPTDTSKITAMFEQYRDDSGAIQVDGIMKLCGDLGVDATDVVMLVLAWRLGASQSYRFSREEWIAGMQSMACDSITALKAQLDRLRSEMEDPAKFKEIYNFSFDFSRNPDQRGLDLETSIGLWGLLLAGRFTYLEKWCEFMSATKKDVSRDTWKMVLEFAHFVQSSKVDLSTYSDSDSWPSLIDDFVEWLRPQIMK